MGCSKTSNLPNKAQQVVILAISLDLDSRQKDYHLWMEERKYMLLLILITVAASFCYVVVDKCKIIMGPSRARMIKSQVLIGGWIMRWLPIRQYEIKKSNWICTNQYWYTEAVCTSSMGINILQQLQLISNYFGTKSISTTNYYQNTTGMVHFEPAQVNTWRCYSFVYKAWILFAVFLTCLCWVNCDYIFYYSYLFWMLKQKEIMWSHLIKKGLNIPKILQNLLIF